MLAESGLWTLLRYREEPIFAPNESKRWENIIVSGAKETTKSPLLITWKYQGADSDCFGVKCPFGLLYSYSLPNLL